MSIYGAYSLGFRAWESLYGAYRSYIWIYRVYIVFRVLDLGFPKLGVPDWGP